MYAINFTVAFNYETELHLKSKLTWFNATLFDDVPVVRPSVLLTLYKVRSSKKRDGRDMKYGNNPRIHSVCIVFGNSFLTMSCLKNDQRRSVCDQFSGALETNDKADGFYASFSNRVLWIFFLR